MRAGLRPAHFGDPDFDTVAYRLSLSQLSLDELRAPIYPQDRFQIGAALAIANRYQLGEKVHVEMQSASDRFSGARRRRMIDGATALREAADEFWLNAIGSMK